MSTQRPLYSIEKRFKPFQQVLDKTRRLGKFKQTRVIENKRMALKQQILDAEKIIKQTEYALQQHEHQLIHLSSDNAELKEQTCLSIKRLKKSLRIVQVKHLILKHQYLELTASLNS